MTKIYNLHELEEMLQVTQRTLYNYIKAGRLRAVKIGGTWRVTEENLNAFLNGDTQEK